MIDPVLFDEFCGLIRAVITSKAVRGDYEISVFFFQSYGRHEFITMSIIVREPVSNMRTESDTLFLKDEVLVYTNVMINIAAEVQRLIKELDEEIESEFRSWLENPSSNEVLERLQQLKAESF